MESALEFYHALRDRESVRETALRARYERLALIRLAVFIAWVAGLIVLFSTDWRWGLVFFAVSIPLLAWGVRQHLAIGRAATAAGVRARLADEEIAALHHDFSAFAGGVEFLSTGHPYALDLDVFGQKSLFQMINRTVTSPGRAWLARQLSAPLKKEERARTQVRGTVLGRHPDWCLEFRTIGDGLEDQPEYFKRLLDWLDRPAAVGKGIERILLPLSPILTLAGLAWMLIMEPWGFGVLAFLPAIYLIRKYKDIAATEHNYTAKMGDLLQGYSALLHHLESRPDQASDWNTELHGAARPAVKLNEEINKSSRSQRAASNERSEQSGSLLPGTAEGRSEANGAGGELKSAASSPTKSLNKLAYYISQLDVRNNPFSILLEVSGLWSIRWLRELDRWRETHRKDLPRWLHELAEADAAVSWGTLRFDRPDWTDPEFVEEPEFSASGMGHPLLPPDGRVTNDLSLRTDGHIHLVTGSNMAGKSTWLRTVGVNLVLAQAGGPVCASHLRTRPLQVWTSMRTQDDLSESTSSFYAELKRLKSIIEAVGDDDQQVFFLLDEILKGTNSRDRHTGSRALIRQLIRERGAGIIATHDLELGAMEAEPGSRVENFAMEVRVDEAELIFDYKLHPGVCQSFNATALMARMGIDIPEEEIKLRHD